MKQDDLVPWFLGEKEQSEVLTCVYWGGKKEYN